MNGGTRHVPYFVFILMRQLNLELGTQRFIELLVIFIIYFILTCSRHVYIYLLAKISR